MLHPVSPFHARKINDEFLLSEHKKANKLDDECNIHGNWYEKFKQHMIPTLIISLTRKEIDALKVYTTYWQTYKKYIMDNFDKIKQDPSTLDKFPKNLLSVIEMHFKNAQTPNNDNTKWGERFNHSMIDGMLKYIDSIKSLQHKISQSLSSLTSTDQQNKSLFIIPKLSTDMLLPFDSIYESMRIFNILDEKTIPQNNDGCDILRTFYDAVWNSLSYTLDSPNACDILDILCRSGLLLKPLNLGLLSFPDDDEYKDDYKQPEHMPKLSMVLQLYSITDKLQNTECIMDKFIEFRMFIADKNVTGITQMQTFLHIISQDHLNKASKSFLIPLKQKMLVLWNSVFTDHDIDEQKEMKYDSEFEMFQANIKRVLLDKYNNIKRVLFLNNVDNFCIDFVVIRQMDNQYEIKVVNIHRLPIYPHDYGMYIWENDKEKILNKSTDSNNWNVQVKRDDGCSMEFADTNAVLSANVYSCVMDYFIEKKWIKKPKEKNNERRNTFKFCTVL
eukprot:401428_1